ncbi:MAG: hypothetical protein DRQ55_08115 [Planctomycetota bacterium]|nr:MAG: hypothetical protein DRQ55_08115 [Planctomycetota bacterium]
MDRAAFALFAKLEQQHWWFRGRRGLYLPLLEHVLRRQGVTPGQLTVADLGCGVGGFLAPMQRFGRVIGLELDEPAVAFAHERGRSAMAVAACDPLPLADASIDLATLWDVLEHTPDDTAVLREAARVLRPGGHLALSVPAYQFLFAHNDEVAHHYRRYTRGAVLRRLRAAGLEPVKATYVNVTLSPLIIPAVLALKLKQRLLCRGHEGANNLTVRTPRVANALLARVFAAERALLKHVSAPFGHSILAVARRPRER